VEAQADEARLIDAMKAASQATVTGTSKRGTMTRDTYSARRASDALDKVSPKLRHVSGASDHASLIAPAAKQLQEILAGEGIAAKEAQMRGASCRTGSTFHGARDFRPQ